MSLREPCRCLESKQGSVWQVLEQEPDAFGWRTRIRDKSPNRSNHHATKRRRVSPNQRVDDDVITQRPRTPTPHRRVTIVVSESESEWSSPQRHTRVWGRNPPRRLRARRIAGIAGWDTDDDTETETTEEYDEQHSEQHNEQHSEQQAQQLIPLQKTDWIKYNVFAPEKVVAGAQPECSICQEFTKVGTFYVLTSCQHSFCCACLEHWENMQTSQTEFAFSCPVCRQFL